MPALRCEDFLISDITGNQRKSPESEEHLTIRLLSPEHLFPIKKILSSYSSKIHPYVLS